MISEFHFIRPFWLIALFGVLLLAWRFVYRRASSSPWNDVCDKQFLPYLMQTTQRRYYLQTLLPVLSAATWMIIALSGPTWSRYPVPTYQKIVPRVLVLSLSEDMLQKDLSPNRLSRAKFKLHDIFQKPDLGQLGLVVFTQDAFVVSPLTEDAHTIDALLPFLTPDVMPIKGHRLAAALEEAKQLFKQAGFESGQILVMTCEPPSRADIVMARSLAKQHMDTSIIPILAKGSDNPAFQAFARAAHGQLIRFDDRSSDLDKWLSQKRMNTQYAKNIQGNIPVWRDEGLWFLIPALLSCLPLFQRGSLMRLRS